MEFYKKNLNSCFSFLKFLCVFIVFLSVLSFVSSIEFISKEINGGIYEISQWGGDDTFCSNSFGCQSGIGGIVSPSIRNVCEIPTRVEITIPKEVDLSKVSFIKLNISFFGSPTKIYLWKDLSCFEESSTLSLCKNSFWGTSWDYDVRQINYSCSYSSYDSFSETGQFWFPVDNFGELILDVNSKLKDRKFIFYIAQKPIIQTIWGKTSIIKTVDKINANIMFYYIIKKPYDPSPPSIDEISEKLFKVYGNKLDSLSIVGQFNVSSGEKRRYNVSINVDKPDSFWKDGNYQVQYFNWVLLNKDGNSVKNGDFIKVDGYFNDYIDIEFEDNGYFVFVPFIVQYGMEYDENFKEWNVFDYEIIGKDSKILKVYKNFKNVLSYLIIFFVVVWVGVFILIKFLRHK